MRDKILEAIIYILLAFLLCGFFNLQIIHGPQYRRMSEDNRIRTIPIVAPRGRIYDRNGLVLADNKAIFNLSIIPDDFDSAYVPHLAEIIGDDVAELSEKVERMKRLFDTVNPVLVKKDVSRTAMYRLEELSTLVGGIVITQDSLRYYPEGETTCHAVGYIGKITPEEYAAHKHQGWLMNEYVGRLGIEKTFNDVLMGKTGGRQIEVNARGQKISVLSEKDALIGQDVRLTIDKEFQSRIIEIFGDEFNLAACIMDIQSGEIIAMVSTPLFDPNIFVDPNKSDERVVALQDERRPFVNRPISLPYAPGSIFKVLIAVAALQEKVINSGTPFYCSGSFRLNNRSRPFKCWKETGHGTMRLQDAIAQSCNSYFYQVGLKLGNERIAKYARMFGFGQAVDLGLPYSKPGLVPDALWKSTILHERWYPGETVNYAIGQGYLEVTPLQVVRMVAAIGNGGTLVEPHIVKDMSSSGSRVQIEAKNLAIVRGAMLLATESDKGTAHLARPMFFKMGGKTGTAQTVGEPHAWCTGFFPYNDPQIAVVVLAEHAGAGGIVAAGYAGQIADEWLALKEEREGHQIDL
jgi:penicillin-binding protein 2